MSIKKAIIILSILAVVATIAVLAMAGDGSDVEYITARAEQGSIVQTVSETGTLRSQDEIDLNFLNTGRLAVIHHRIGDTVKAGDLLLELDYSALEVRENEAQAALDIAREKLNKYLSGSTDEEIAVARASAIQAQAAYDAARNELDRAKEAAAEAITQAQSKLYELQSDLPSNITTYEQAITTARNDLANSIATYQKNIDDYRESGLTTAEDKLASAQAALESINRIITDEDADGQISRKDPGHLTLTEGAYDQALVSCSIADDSLSDALASTSNEAVLAVLSDAYECLDITFDSLEHCFDALEDSVTSSDFTQTEVDAFKTTVSGWQTTVGSALTSVQTAGQNLNDSILTYDTTASAKEDALAAAIAAYDNAVTTAENTLATAKISGSQSITSAQSKVDTYMEAWQVAQAQLNQVLAPANKHDISLARAQVRQAEANLESIREQIEDSRIYSPIDGTVTKLEYEVGEQITLSSQPPVSVLGQGSFEIEVLISEADIAKIELGDRAEITLDAFGDDTEFSGSVVFIEPAETVIQDVIYYQVDLDFDPAGYDVKSGMTANATITTAEKDDVLLVPARAVISKNGSGKYVRVLENGQPRERPVEIGLRGDEGRVEIISGLEAGNTVVTSIHEKD